jgi:hypothetical protein
LSALGISGATPESYGKCTRKVLRQISKRTVMDFQRCRLGCRFKQRQMSWTHLRIFLHVFILSLQFNRIWNALYPQYAEVVAFKMCFAALPSYTHCKTYFCFEYQNKLSEFLLTNVFTEHLDLCQVMRAYELYILRRQDLKAWKSLLHCMDSNFGRNGEIETFPFFAPCIPIWEELKSLHDQPPDIQTNMSATI